MTERACVVCPQLRTNAEPRVYDRPNVCAGCRSRLRSLLAEVLDCYAQLTEDPTVNAGAWVETITKGSKEVEITHVDPVALKLPAGPMGRSTADPISGTREPPLPGGEALNLSGPSNPSTTGRLVPAYRTTGPPPGKPKVDPCQDTMVDKDGVTHRCTEPFGHIHQHRDDEYRWAYAIPPWSRAPILDDKGRHVLKPDGDQLGHPGVPAVLDSWARDWQTYRPTWEHLPLPTVSSLVGWLTDRLDWACDEHPAIDDFADELRGMTAVLRSAAGMNRPKAELKLGVPCRECETVALFRWPGSPYIECGACNLLLTDEEFARWTQLLAAPEHQPWVRSIAEKESAA